MVIFISQNNSLVCREWQPTPREIPISQILRYLRQGLGLILSKIDRDGRARSVRKRLGTACWGAAVAPGLAHATTPASPLPSHTAGHVAGLPEPWRTRWFPLPRWTRWCRRRTRLEHWIYWKELKNIPMTLELLQSTRIGTSVNAIRKQSTRWGYIFSKVLIKSWNKLRWTINR